MPPTFRENDTVRGPRTGRDEELVSSLFCTNWYGEPGVEGTGSAGRQFNLVSLESGGGNGSRGGRLSRGTRHALTPLTGATLPRGCSTCATVRRVTGPTTRSDCRNTRSTGTLPVLGEIECRVGRPRPESGPDCMVVHVAQGEQGPPCWLEQLHLVPCRSLPLRARCANHAPKGGLQRRKELTETAPGRPGGVRTRSDSHETRVADSRRESATRSDRAAHAARLATQFVNSSLLSSGR
jgi:hypothetical protein